MNPLAAHCSLRSSPIVSPPPVSALVVSLVPKAMLPISHLYIQRHRWAPLQQRIQRLTNWNLQQITIPSLELTSLAISILVRKRRPRVMVSRKLGIHIKSLCLLQIRIRVNSSNMWSGAPQRVSTLITIWWTLWTREKCLNKMVQQ